METGYVAAPGPFLATAALYASITGEDTVTGTVAILDDPVQQFVLEADRVERIAVLGPGPAIAVVDASVLADRLRVVPTIDFSRRLFHLTVEDLALEFRATSPATLTAWRDRVHACFAAEMVGTARRIFDMALQYAKDRRQFDVPIGSFQAMQHKLADMSLALERAAAAVHYAAMTVDAADPERTKACHVAKAAAGEAARRIAKDGIQIHGGIGYTWEHDLHLFLRRAIADEYLFGSTGWHHDRLADHLIG